MRKNLYKKTLLHATITLTGIALLAITALMFILTRDINVPPQGMLYDYKPGMSVKSLSSDLKQKQIIKYPRVFEIYTRITGRATSLHAGEYRFAQGMSARDIIRQISAGKVVLHPFKIIEGWNIHDLIAKLQATENIEHTMDFSNNDWLIFITTEYTHPEGLFMPDTYFYTKDESDQIILQRAFNEMQKTLTKAWENKSPELQYADPYQALIVASIVEKETSILDEQPEIAGVLVRRLNHNMRLQMDPTVIYGMGAKFNGNITKANLQTDTPYNTYTRRGLPPTPIAMPSREAIYAALHPEEGTSLFFVAKGDGSHCFSDTLEEHNKAVVKYILRTKEQDVDEQS